MNQFFDLKVIYNSRPRMYKVEVLWRTHRLVRFKVEYQGKGFYELNYLAAQKNNRWKIKSHSFKPKDVMAFGKLTQDIFRALEYAMKPPERPMSHPKNTTAGEVARLFQKSVEEYERAIEEWERLDYWTKI